MFSLSICDKGSILTDKFSYYLAWHCVQNGCHFTPYAVKNKCTIHDMCRKAKELPSSYWNILLLMFTKSSFTATWPLVSTVILEHTLTRTPSGNKGNTL